MHHSGRAAGGAADAGGADPGGAGLDIKLVDDSGPDVRLLVVDPQLDGSDCFGLYAIPEA